jgi:hypothetical protein
MAVGWEAIAYYVIAFLVGALAGAADIVSRYRDEPFLAANSKYGVVYIGLNGVLAVLVYTAFGFKETGGEIKPALADDLFLNALAAGAGSMLILRSRLFTIRSENGKQTAFGPAIIVDALLTVLDRQIDRERAAARHKLVFDNLNGIHDFDATVAYFQMSLLSFQNLSQQEKADLVSIIQEYKKVAQWSGSLRTMAVGFAILTIAGEDNFGKFVDGLKLYLEEQEPNPPGADPAPVPEPSGLQPVG